MVIGYMVVAIIALPPISGPFMTGYQNLTIVLGLSIASFITALIYSILCFTRPGFLNSPPAMIRSLAQSMSSKKPLKERCSYFWMYLKESNTLGGNLLLAVRSDEIKLNI